MAVLGAGIVALGFFVGSTIGDDDGGWHQGHSAPRDISTRQGSVLVPTLNQASRIPPLNRTEAAEEPDEEAGSEPEVQGESEFDPETANPTQQSDPEVTVAPNG